MQLFEHAPTPYLILDTRGTISEANPAAAALLGLERKALSGLSLGSFLRGPEKALFADAVDACVSCRGTAEADLTVTMQGRPALNVHLLVTCLHIDAGEGADILASLSAVAGEAGPSREEERLFREALASSPLVLFSQDRELRYTWLHDSRERVVPAEVIGRTDFDLFSMEAAGQLTELKQWVLSHGTTRREIIQASFTERDYGFVDLTVFPRFDAANSVTGVRGIAFDVTDTLTLENSLRRGQRRLLLAMENIPAWFLILDPDRRVLFCNSEAARALGRPGEPPVGLKDEDFFLRETVAAYLPLFSRAMETKFRQRQELSMPCETGPIEVDLAFVPLLDSNGDVEEILVFGHDLTSRRRAEEILERSEATYRLLFEANPDPVWVYDSQSLRFLAVNDAAVREYGYSRDEFLRMGLGDLMLDEEQGTIEFPPEEEAAPMQAPPEGEAAQARERQVSGPWRHRRKDGSVLEVELKTEEIDYEGRSARIVLVNDVTLRLHAEHVLRQSEKRFRSIIEGSHLPILMMDEEGVITAISQPGCGILGWNRQELAGNNWRMLFQSGFEVVYQKLAELLRRRNPNARAILMTRVHTSDGKLRWVEWDVSLSMSEERVAGFFARLRDLGNPLAS